MNQNLSIFIGQWFSKPPPKLHLAVWTAYMCTVHEPTDEAKGVSPLRARPLLQGNQRTQSIMPILSETGRDFNDQDA